MIMLQGRPMVSGHGAGAALVTRMPINFTAAFSKPQNLLPSRRAEFRDRHHDLFGRNLAGSVVVFPACIGSTLTGLVLMQLISEGKAPVALLVQRADSLLISGAVLAKAWFDSRVPVVEYTAPDLFEKIKTGDHVSVNGETGEIGVTAANHARSGRAGSPHM
jgi:predicted aconitase with swiveling domain